MTFVTVKLYIKVANTKCNNLLLTARNKAQKYSPRSPVNLVKANYSRVFVVVPCLRLTL